MILKLPAEMISEIVNQCFDLKTLQSLCKTSIEIRIQAMTRYLVVKYKGINNSLAVVVMRALYPTLRYPLTEDKAKFWERQCQKSD